VRRDDGSVIILPTKVSDDSIEASIPMISSLQVEGYRGLAQFRMGDLQRVNLLVGKNNSGKTSALEAIFLLATRGDPSTLWQILWRRGERLSVSADRSRDRPPDLDVSHLFSGHGMRLVSSSQPRIKRQSVRWFSRSQN